MICWFYKELAFKRYRKGKWLQNGLSGHSQIETSSSPSSVCTWLVQDHLGILLMEQEDPHTPDVGTFAQSQRQNPLSDGLYPKTITHDKCMRGWCTGELISSLLTPQRISETPKKHSSGGDHSEGHWHGGDTLEQGPLQRDCGLWVLLIRAGLWRGAEENLKNQSAVEETRKKQSSRKTRLETAPTCASFIISETATDWVSDTENNLRKKGE